MPTCKYVSEHKIFHVDFFSNGRTEFFPKEYVRLLEAGTKYHEISGLQADSFSQFGIRQEYSRYYNTALDNGLSFFPYRPESKTFVGEFVTVTTDNDEFEYLSEIKIDDDIKEDYMPTTADVETLHEDSGSNYGRFFNQWRR